LRASCTVLSSKPPIGGAIAVLVVAVAVGASIVVSPVLALAATGLTIVGTLALRTPAWSVVVLAGIAVLQPLLLRLIPDTADIWIVFKRIDEFSLAAVTPLAVLQLARHGRAPFTRTTTIGLSVVCAIGLLGVLLNSTPPPVALLDAFLLFKGFLFFVFVLAFTPRAHEAKRLFQVLFWFAVCAGLLGFLEVLAPDSFRAVVPLARTGYRIGRVCLVSIMESEGQAGWFFAFLGTCSFAFYLAYRRMAFLAAFAFFATCALLTLRRKPLGGMVAMMILAALLSSRPSQKLKILLVIVGAVLMVGMTFADTVAPIFLEGWDQYVTTAEPMKVARNAMYATSVRLALDYFPIGVGFGLFGGFGSQMYYSPIYYDYGLSKIWGLSPEFSRFMMDAFWPHVLGQFGFLGLAAFLLAFYGIWRPILVRFRAATDVWTRAVTLAALLTFTEALVESGAESIFEGTLPSFFIFGLAAFALSTGTREKVAPPA
jgi:hypothetical protein